MGVLQFPIPIPVTVGSLPSLKFMVTTDNFVTITTANYLNSANMDSANPMAPTDIVMALYNYDPRFQTGTFEIFTVTIDVRGVITLNLWNGGVVLPVEVNDIAMFYNTLGAIYDGVNVTARHQGNIQAGLSGTQGGFISFPSSANAGNFIFEASASSPNAVGVVTNQSLGQSSNFLLPDPGVANSLVAVSPTNLVNNNLVKAVGTLGLIADSGIPFSTVMQNNIVNTLTPMAAIVANKSTGTSSGGVVSTNGMAGFIITESLTTAGGARDSLTWINPFITTTSVGFLTTQGGTNANNDYTFDVVMGGGSANILINNNSTSPLSGTIVFGYVLF
jgi:hypothetical protein